LRGIFAGVNRAQVRLPPTGYHRQNRFHGGAAASAERRVRRTSAAPGLDPGDERHGEAVGRQGAYPATVSRRPWPLAQSVGDRLRRAAELSGQVRGILPLFISSIICSRNCGRVLRACRGHGALLLPQGVGVHEGGPTPKPVPTDREACQSRSPPAERLPESTTSGRAAKFCAWDALRRPTARCP
jgi:hypothetical protein